MSVALRRLGRTEQHVSAIGLGGFHIGQSHLADSEAIALIHGAIDGGITFLDNSWDYNGGTSEMRMGRALSYAGYRDRSFLMTKIDGRTKRAAEQQIDESLARLLTDRIDLLQFHEVIRLEDADRIFAHDGALEAVLAAKAAGKVRFIGFTGHKSPAIHLHMLEVARAHDFAFDTIQMPLNVMDAHFRSFERLVLPVARDLDLGTLAMKTFGDAHILKTGLLQPIDMLHYGLNLGTSVVITGIDSRPVLEQAFRAIETFVPLAAEDIAAMLAKTAPFANDGATELYKTSHFFDSTVQNPEWLG